MLKIIFEIRLIDLDEIATFNRINPGLELCAQRPQFQFIFLPTS
jgi:hypothetical protein